MKFCARALIRPASPGLCENFTLSHVRSLKGERKPVDLPLSRVPVTYAHHRFAVFFGFFHLHLEHSVHTLTKLTAPN